MATGSQPDSAFYGFYDEYMGEAQTKPEVYGYWILVLGLVAILAAAGVFAAGRTGLLGLSPAALTELTLILAAAGFPVFLLGTVLQLPLRRRAVPVAVLGALVSVAAVGYFLQIYPGQWGVGKTQGQLFLAGYGSGLALLALVAALVPVVTGRRSYLLADEDAAAMGWVVEDETEARVSDVLVGEADRDGVFAVFPGESGWHWWFVEQAAVADGTRAYDSQTDAEAALEEIKAKVAGASLLEINHAAFRLYREAGEDGESTARWTLVDEDGVVLADSDGRYADREKAESAVNLLKEHGPGASLLDVEDGAFEVYGDGSDWRWRLVDENRGVLGDGPQAYEDRDDAEASVRSIREAARESPVMDVEQVGVELIEADGTWRWELLDADDETIAQSSDEFDSREAVEGSVRRIMEGAIDMPFLESGSPAYEVVEGDEGGWRWRLVDADDAVVARSEGAVPSEESGRSVVGRVKEVVADAPVVELDDAEYEIYPEGDQWAWRLVTEDRETVARSPASATFADPEAAAAAVEQLREEIETADRIEFDSAAFHLYEADEGGWNWRLVDADGSVVSDSGQEHASREDAAAAMNTMKQHAPEADLVEIGSAALELYEAESEWHWRLVDASGDTLATSPGRYDSDETAREAMDALSLLAPEAETRQMDAALFQVYVGEGERRQWCWRLIHPDGSTIARSLGGFTDRESATEAAESVADFAADAAVHTVEDIAIRFSVIEGEEGEAWEWEIVDREREPLAVGTEQFPSRDAVATTARLVRDNAGGASVFAVDPAAFRLETVTDEDSGTERWRWRLVDPDRNTLAVGARTHESRESARVDLSRARELAGGAGLLDFDLAAFEVTERQDGWIWRFVDTAGNTVGISGPTFESRSGAERALASVRDVLTTASLLEIGSPAFELHEDDGEDGWRWRLVDTDGSTVAESKRTYPTRREAREALGGLREFGPDAATETQA
ncbi:DUF1508 domain-containing protein [Halorientalis regularis]|uniref:DUF1508 domain-containing protein n=1 Tax=Halorientalis regularis TaxID=660518 RepID=A0A1G7J4Y9_9EURY|nr:DUF1508 domain-containing protein [Halorientalis regularis]SDF19990.1 protein of unknown function [Halorientalis regularis]